MDFIFYPSKLHEYLQLNVTLRGPTVINHPIPIKQESTQETLPAVFLMEKRCAPLSPSSNKHKALAPV